MTQAKLLDIGPAAAPATTCPLCGGKLVMRRCRPCQKDTPVPAGPAWTRWTKGICRTVRSRCDAAGLGRLATDTWGALVLDMPLPAETAALVADIAALPFSVRRYQRLVAVALIRSQIETHLVRQGFPNGAQHDWVADNIAAAAAERIQAQRDRVAAGEVFERRHDAELVHEAVLEHEAREALRGARLRGDRLEEAVRMAVEWGMAPVRGSYGRPSDEYPTAARVELTGLRVAVPVRVEASDDVAVDEAAAEEAAVPQRGRAA